MVPLHLLGLLQVSSSSSSSSSSSLLPTFRSGSQRCHYHSLLCSRTNGRALTQSNGPTGERTQHKKCPLLYIYIYILLAFYLFQTRNIFLLHGIVDGSIYTAVPWRATGISIFPNCSGKNISIQDRRTEELKKRERLELDTPWPRKPPFFFSFVCNS